MASKPVSVEKLLDPDTFADQASVMCISGTLTKLFKANKGDEYEYQNGEFKDSTGKIKIVFSKCTQPQGSRNQKVTITSQKTNHGWQGVRVEDREYEKDGETKHERQLKITPSAEIEYGSNGSGGGDNGGDDEPQNTSRKSSGGNGGSTGHPAKERSTPAVHPLVAIKDMLKLHTTLTALVSETYGKDIDKDAKQAAVATLFIECAKMGLIWDFEKKAGAPIQKAHSPAPKDPKKWKQAVIPAGANEGKTLEEVSDEDLMKYHEYYDKKGDNSALAECIYQAAADRKLLPDPEPENEGNDAGDDTPRDDIPF